MPSEIIVAIIGAAAVIINVVLTSFLNNYASKKKQTDKDDKLVHDSLRCILRASIIREYDDYMKRGYCEVHEKVNVDEQYKVYHALGGNGTITAIHEKIMELPTEPPMHSEDHEHSDQT